MDRRLVLCMGFLACLPTSGIARAAEPCLPYEPAVVTLTGKLVERTYPGPPNYASVEAGDEPETHYYLALAKPICTTAGGELEPAQSGVKEVQLVLENEGYARLRAMLGKTVTLSGTMFARHTGHHHAPVLLEPQVPADKK